MSSQMFDEYWLKMMPAFDTMKREIETNKARRKDRKTYCGHCQQTAANGAKLQTCSRCKAINYCSPVCQKEHWKTGHKSDCNGFVMPPFAKNFRPGEGDPALTTAPDDPIFGHANQEGVGIWVTTNGTLSPSLQQAFIPADHPVTPNAPQGPASFRRWAKIEGPNGAAGWNDDSSKYLGPTLMCFRIIVQNRRQDGTAVVCLPGQTLLDCENRLGDVFLPEDKKLAHPKPFFYNNGERSDGYAIPPWTDYNKLLRVAILEINGINAPRGKFVGPSAPMNPKMEYERPPFPSGAPWERILDWPTGAVSLAPGDHVVYAVQYRVGDGKKWQYYPDLMYLTYAVSMPMFTTSIKTNVPRWTELVRVKTRELIRGKSMLLLRAPWDRKYLDVFFKTWFDDPDEFLKERYGRRGTEMHSAFEQFGPNLLRNILSTLSEAERAEVVRRSSTMGFDIDQMLKDSET